MKRKQNLKICMYPASVPKNDNQFVRLLVDSLVLRGVEIIAFNWKTVLFKQYDILHLHWPEHLFPSSRKTTSLIKLFLLLLLIFKIRLKGISLLWTVHNLEPHEERNGIYKYFHKYFIEKVSYKIFMQKNFNPDKRSFYIPHGNYAELFEREGIVVKQDKACMAVAFGYIRPYKNIEHLIKYFPTGFGKLLVAGMPINQDYGIHLQDYVSNNSIEAEISLNLKQLSEQDLLELIVSSEIAIFPYKKIYNSGAVLLALSAPIPVIVTESASMKELQLEVGAEWLQIIPSEFDKTDLQSAIEQLSLSHSLRGIYSPLSGIRNWDVIARSYEEIYSNLIVEC